MTAVDKLSRAENLFREATRDTVSFEQLAGLLRTVADAITTAKKDLKDALDKKTLEYLRRYNAITDLVDETATELNSSINTKADARTTRDQMERLRSDVTRLVDDVRDDIPELPNLAPLERQLDAIKAAIPPKVDGSALWGAVNTLQDALDAVRQDISGLRKTSPTRFGMFTPRGFQLYVDGTKVGQVNEVNFVGATFTKSNGRNDVTISGSGGGGGGLSILTATGTVDDSNTAFSFASAPLLVVVNGTAYRHGHGVTISGSNATLDNPAGTGGDVYALG